MPAFRSSREKMLWILAGLAVLAIGISLFIDRETQLWLVQDSVQFWLFLGGLVLTGLAVLFHGLKNPLRAAQGFLIVGTAAIGTMLIFRLGASERSHIIEYCVLTLLVYEALLERRKYGKLAAPAALTAFLLGSGIGVLDEALQGLLPNRVMALEDAFFNTMASAFAILGSLFLGLIKKFIKRYWTPGESR